MTEKGYKVRIFRVGSKGCSFNYFKDREKAEEYAKKTIKKYKELRENFDFDYDIVEKELRRCIHCGNLTEDYPYCLGCNKILYEVENEL